MKMSFDANSISSGSFQTLTDKRDESFGSSRWRYQTHFDRSLKDSSACRSASERSPGTDRNCIERHLHGEFIALCLERRRIEIASPFIHHAGDEICGPFLAGWIIGRAAREGELHGDERIGVIFDQPSDDAGLLFTSLISMASAGRT